MRTGALTILAPFALAACRGNGDDNPTTTPFPTPQPTSGARYRVAYTLTFERAVPCTSANWTNATGGNEREADLMSLRRTWEYTMPAGEHVLLGASTGSDAQRVECSISVNGVEVEHTHADGCRLATTCSAIVGPQTHGNAP